MLDGDYVIYIRKQREVDYDLDSQKKENLGVRWVHLDFVSLILFRR